MNPNLAHMFNDNDLVFPNRLDDIKDAEILPFFSITDEDEEGTTIAGESPKTLPILALKNTVLFPGVIIPITVGRTKSVNAVKEAYDKDKLIAVFSQKSPDTKTPGLDDLYRTGAIARIVKLITMPDGNTTAILKGSERSILIELSQEEPYLKGVVQSKPDTLPQDVKFKARISSIKDIAKNIIELSQQIPNEATLMLANIQNDSHLLNFISSNIAISTLEKQNLLEMTDIVEKAKIIHKKIDEEQQMLEVKGQIESKVKGDIERQQRDYFLNQQLKTIQDLSLIHI